MFALSDREAGQPMMLPGFLLVRAGVVKEPALWSFCGDAEVQRPKQRSRIIDMEKLMELLEVRGPSQVRTWCRDRVVEVLASHTSVRESKWSESVSAGNERFVAETKARLDVRAAGRQIRGDEGSFELREPATAYTCDFAPENEGLRPENAHLFDVTD